LGFPGLFSARETKFIVGFRKYNWIHDFAKTLFFSPKLQDSVITFYNQEADFAIIVVSWRVRTFYPPNINQSFERAAHPAALQNPEKHPRDLPAQARRAVINPCDKVFTPFPPAIKLVNRA
jgi:hypothetical protein